MNIIFVCSGNTCRSPFAMGYFNSLGLKDFTAESRGLMVSGQPVSRNSAIIAKEYGFSIDNHISATFTKDDFNADYIFTMSKEIRDFLIANGGNTNKIFTLGNGISDPFGGDLEIYRQCMKSIVSEINDLVFNGFFYDFIIEDMKDCHISQIAHIEKLFFSEPWSETSITESSKSNTDFFVASKNENVRGYIGLNHILDEGYITSFAVTKENQNKNIGTLLLNKCFSFGREKELSFISLEVRKSNFKAISLYNKLGFEEKGIRRNFYSFPKEDAIIMTRRLKD